MKGELSYCGLSCNECQAGKATREGDRELLGKTARAWSKAFGSRYTVEDVTCDGCKSPGGRKSRYCRECKVGPCAEGRGLGTCAECGDYPCDNLAAFLRMAPEAKRNLEAERTKRKAKRGKKAK
jgi:hypothetical protein